MTSVIFTATLFNTNTLFHPRETGEIIMAQKHRSREGKAEKCGVENCDANGHKSLSIKKVKSALPNVNLKEKRGKRLQLCKSHYKLFKKKTKWKESWKDLDGIDSLH